MKKLPETDNSLLLRTDFSDDAAWASLCIVVQQPNEEGFRAHLDCFSDPAYDRLGVEELVAVCPKGGDRTFAFIADRTTFTDPERPAMEDQQLMPDEHGLGDDGTDSSRPCKPRHGHDQMHE